MIGRRIRKIRETLGMNKTEFANRLGISTAYVCLIEGDKRKPSYKLMQVIIDRLGVEPRILFKGLSKCIK